MFCPFDHHQGIAAPGRLALLKLWSKTMTDAQITVLFMVAAITVTAFALYRNQALGRKALALVLASLGVVAGFIFLTLGN